MLSSRDLWVEIPDFEHNRINTAYFLGESFRMPGGGPALAMRTVENLLGVPVQYYAVIEFGAFERAIDEVGGLDIQVFEDIKLSPLGRTSFWARIGSHHFDGASALAYARARKTEGGDFDRAERQQQVVLAIRDSVFEMGVAELLARAPAIYRQLASGIHTNLSFDQMVALGLMGVQIQDYEVRRGVIAPPDMVLLETHPDGSQVLKPVPDAIRQLRDQVFTGAGAISPSVAVDPPEGAARLENARVAVLNGAGVEGLASDAAEYQQQGSPSCRSAMPTGTTTTSPGHAQPELSHTLRYLMTCRHRGADPALGVPAQRPGPGSHPGLRLGQRRAPLLAQRQQDPHPHQHTQGRPGDHVGEIVQPRLPGPGSPAAPRRS
jgi:LCP family protein required for cell wall assembly